MIPKESTLAVIPRVHEPLIAIARPMARPTSPNIQKNHWKNQLRAFIGVGVAGGDYIRRSAYGQELTFHRLARCRHFSNPLCLRRHKPPGMWLNGGLGNS